MAEAALGAPVIPGRAQWQGAAGPVHVQRFVVSRLAIAVWAALGAAAGAWGFVGGAAFQPNPAFWTMVAVFAGLPLVSGIAQLLIERPSPVERYLLTDRFFVVESNRGCHAYNLETLRDLTVDLEGNLGRLLLRRKPDVSPELGWVMRVTAWLNGKDAQLRVVLADRLEDAPGLLRRIRAAQAALPEASAQSAQSAQSAPSAEEVCVVAADIPQSMPYEWGSLLGAITVALVILVATPSFLFHGNPSLSLPMLAMLAVVGWYAWNGLRVREHGLLQRGRWVMGEITEIKHTDARSDDWRVRYRYPVEDGSHVRAQLTRSNFAQIERWGVGDLIEVRYDPNHPERHLVRSYA
jgi:hypothetical protein